ncbi:hypothetical protein [Ralstonia phage RSP15]|uniref:hypothetical protein n=1 Tax=Ralstonia phage RSP15 TaxID=1785960 RepID=UPI00074D319C|nr:hypothetical protein BH754_gp024 [Ralstonia phage RSP15]BAU39982.1 hypothetical protein [Ralstonia phage RSP15]
MATRYAIMIKVPEGNREIHGTGTHTKEEKEEYVNFMRRISPEIPIWLEEVQDERETCTYTKCEKQICNVYGCMHKESK